MTWKCHTVCLRTIDKSMFIRTTKNTNQLAQSHKSLDILNDYIDFNVDITYSEFKYIHTHTHTHTRMCIYIYIYIYICSINLNILSQIIVVTRFKTNNIKHETQNTSLSERVALYKVYQKVWTIFRGEFSIPKQGHSHPVPTTSVL